MTGQHEDVLQKIAAPLVSRGVLEEGYYHVGGAVARAVDVTDLSTPGELLDTWCLRYDHSRFPEDPDFVDVLRFCVHPLMSLGTLIAADRPWPTYGNGFLGRSALAPMWILDRTRVPPGTVLDDRPEVIRELDAETRRSGQLRAHGPHGRAHRHRRIDP